LIARKLAELFGFHFGFQPFYTACCFDELSRGSILCFLNASFEKQFPQHHNSIFYTEIDDHGVCRGDTGRILARWRRPVASRIALDLPHWAMRSSPYCLIQMAIEMASKAADFFSVVDYLLCIIVAK
jgi:hypothetical protein